MFLNQSPWKVEGEDVEAERNLGRVFVFVGWRQILATKPIWSYSHTDTYTGLIWYGTCPPGLFCSAGISLFSFLSPFSPAESYCICVTCSLSFRLLCFHTHTAYLCTHSAAPTHSCSTNTGMKDSLEVASAVIRLLAPADDCDLRITAVCSFLILLVVNLKMFSLMVFWQRPC